MKMMIGFIVVLFFALLPHGNLRSIDDDSKNENDKPLTLVVMDPLCDKLACDCVKGYAQRKYEALGKFMGQQLNRKVNLYWGESIDAALEETQTTSDIVIGKRSVVEANAKSLNLKLQPVAQLTGSDGRVTQTGLIVVRKMDPANKVADLKGYRIFFGPPDCDEKYAAPMALLRENGIGVPEKPEIAGACSQAATMLMELDADTKAAAVISSYAEPLLAGCGTIEKGDLRVIGVSREVPFVTAFVNQQLPESTRKEITRALLSTGENKELLSALETAKGFVTLTTAQTDEEKDATKRDSAAIRAESLEGGKKN